MSFITSDPKAETEHPKSPLTRLILTGLVTEIIYLIYIFIFPLISNTRASSRAVDIEDLTEDNRWLALVYTLGLFALYDLFWQAIETVSPFKDQPPGNVQATSPTPQDISRQTKQPLKLIILAFGLLFGFTLVWLYPITADDLFRYVVRGRVWAVYGQSPLLSPPSKFPDDPYLEFAGEFGDLVSGYGPVWEMLVQLPLRLGATDMLPAVIGLKFLILFCYLLSAGLIGWVARPEKGDSLLALIFFAWNPLILMQIAGNGHNDMSFLLLIVLGLVLWQRKLWWLAALAFVLSALTKAPAVMMLPLFGLIILRDQPSWRQRILKGLALTAMGLITAYLLYAMLGPISETTQSLSDTVSLSRRDEFSIAANLRLVLREIIPADVAELLPRTTGRYIFLFFYGCILLQLWRRKLTLITAGFLVYFCQVLLWRSFRIWYPTWLIPLAALHLTPAIFWRTFLFGLTAELSILNYFVVWRWWLQDLPWNRLGLLTDRYYWPVMHTLTVPWVFGIPLFGPIILRWWTQKRSSGFLGRFIVFITAIIVVVLFFIIFFIRRRWGWWNGRP
jgi:hypothetical protein